MTLIITEISQYGIAMVADSAVTMNLNSPYGGQVPYVLNGAHKLQMIPYLNAGISMWGAGTLGTLTSDLWIKDFIDRHSHITSLEDFAIELSNTLKNVPGTDSMPMGLHVAGFIHNNEGTLPTCFHVRNCDGSWLLGYSMHEFIVDNTKPEKLEGKARIHVSNGGYALYSRLIMHIENGLQDASNIGIATVPEPSLEGRVLYLKAMVSFISDLYACAGRPRTIGGTISFMGITPDRLFFSSV